MSNVKKRFLTLSLSIAFVLALAIGGLVGVYVANAEPTNWLSISYENKVVSAYVGENVELATVKPVYPHKVERIYYVVHAPNGSIVEVDGVSFFAGTEGDYSVVVCAIGYDGATYAESYSVSVVKSTKPIVAQYPVIPTAFIKGSTYPVPTAEFIDYNLATPATVSYKVYYINEQGVEALVGDTFVPTASLHQAEVGLKYEATSTVTGDTITLNYSVPVLDVVASINAYNETLYDYQKMFATYSVDNAQQTAKGATFYGKGEYSFAYANNLYASFEISLASIENYATFDSVTIDISDVSSPKERITLQIVSGAENSQLTLNGSSVYTVAGTLLNLEKGVSFAFDNTSLTLEDTDGATVTQIKTNASGTEFNGFSSNLVKIKVTVVGSSSSAVTVVNLNGHGFAQNNVVDTILPYVLPSKELKIKNSLGDKVIVPKAFAYDVIDPNVYAGISVFAPDGETVLSTSGVALYQADANKDYEITVEQMGEYTILYYATDANGNSYDYGYYTIVAFDTQAPVIDVAVIKSETTVGSKIKVPTIKCEDNVDAQPTVFVTVTAPNGKVQWLNSGDNIEFNVSGVYYVRYSAVDDHNNISTVEQTVVCR